MDESKGIDVCTLSENIFNHYSSLGKRPASIILYNCGDLREQLASCLARFFAGNVIEISTFSEILEPQKLEGHYHVDVRLITKYPLDFIPFYHSRSVQELARDIQ